MKHTPRHSHKHTHIHTFLKNFTEKLRYQRFICWFTSALFFDSNRCVRKRIRNTEHPRTINVYTIQIFKWEWIHFECEIQNNSGILLNWFCYRLSNAIQHLRFYFYYSLSKIGHPGSVPFFNSTHNLYFFDWIGIRTWLAVNTEKKDQRRKEIVFMIFSLKNFFSTVSLECILICDLWSIRREYLIEGEKQRKRYLSQPHKYALSRTLARLK